MSRKRNLSVYRSRLISTIPEVSSVVINETLGVFSGSYVYTDSGGALEKNETPYVENISISGTIGLGNVLTVSYDFISPSNYSEDNSTIQWYRKVSDVVSPISGANAANYTIVSDDLNNILLVGVIARQTATSPANGNASSLSEQFSDELSVAVSLDYIFKLNIGGSSVSDYIGWTGNTLGSTLSNINGSGINAEVTDGFNNVNTGGVVTGNDSGVVIDAVLGNSFFNNSANNTGVIELTGFSSNQLYQIELGGSRASGTENTAVTVNGTTLEYDPGQNSTIEVVFDGNADVNGVVTITVTGNPSGQNNYIGWIKCKA